MFSWFRRKQTDDPRVPTPPGPAPAPTPPPDFGTDIKIAFSNGQETWEERADLLQVMLDVFQKHGHTVTPQDARAVRLDPSGLILRPVLRSFQPIHPRGVRTTTTVHVAHPTIGDQEVFEFQHANGDSVEESLRKGLDQWAQVDLPVLLDAAAPKPAHSMVMEMTFPATDGAPPRARRAVLGPVAHFAQHRTPTPAANAAEGEHPFCPCCFFTNTFEAFKGLIESDGFYALRFYAARDADGNPQADCRVNGQDHADGAAALRAYVANWPAAGVEFRKQYVVLQNAPAATPAAHEASTL